MKHSTLTNWDRYFIWDYRDKVCFCSSVTNHTLPDGCKSFCHKLMKLIFCLSLAGHSVKQAAARQGRRRRLSMGERLNIHSFTDWDPHPLCMDTVLAKVCIVRLIFFGHFHIAKTFYAFDPTNHPKQTKLNVRYRA